MPVKKYNFILKEQEIFTDLHLNGHLMQLKIKMFIFLLGNTFSKPFYSILENLNFEFN